MTNKQNVLITGALGSLGKAEADCFLAEGYNLYLIDLDVDIGEKYAASLAEGASKDQTIKFIKCDLSDLTKTHSIVSRLAEDIGGIDVLINNAAVIPLKPIEDFSIEEYEQVLRINGHSAFALTKAVTPHMKEKEQGVIVNLCSITMNGAWENFVPYVASKGELLGLTRSLARELGPWNIRVNAISPGAIPSEAEQRVFGDEWEQYNEKVLLNQALKHRGEPSDIGDAIVFLAGKKAKFITGQNIHVNGGWYMEG